jgi:hypothetical protein
MIPQTDIVSMQRIDEVEISPHEPIAAIHAVDAAL